MWTWWTVDPNGFQLRGCCKLLTGFLCLLVTVFFVHWQSGFLCSRVCVTVLPGGAWYQPRLGTATPATAALLPHLPSPPTTMCASSLLRNWCILSCTRKFGSVVRRHGQGRSRRVQLEPCLLPGFRPQRRVMLLLALEPPSHLSSTGAVKQETFNSQNNGAEQLGQV